MTYTQVITAKLLSFLSTIQLRMQHWRSPPPPLPPPSVAPTLPKPIVPSVKDGSWDMSRKGVEDSGTFYFKKNILDDLEHYFRALERFHATDPDAYDLYSQVGGTVVPERALSSLHTLPALWSDQKSRPAFGCAWLGGNENDLKFIWARFVYFQKIKQLPSTVERAPLNHDIYSVYTFFDNPNLATEKKWRRFLKRHGYVISFYIALDPAGNCQVLKTSQAHYTQTTYRGGTDHYGKTRKRLFTESIPCTRFDYPQAFQELYQNHEHKKEFTDIHAMGLMYLAISANFGIGNEMAIRVDASNGKGVASFSVDWKRTAYFFKDRNTVLTDRGKKARIFHIVRPHERQVGNKVINIHMHFRGLRRFKWNGYDVRVSVPGLHHIGLHEFTPGAEEWGEYDPKEWRTMKQVGSALQRHVQGASLEGVFSAEKLDS